MSCADILAIAARDSTVLVRCNLSLILKLSVDSKRLLISAHDGLISF